MDSRYLPLGWLSPNGEFVDCNHFGHFSIARDILDRLDLDVLHTSCRHPDDKLLELGWVHITICTLGKRELVIFWDRNRFLTESQKRFLKPYFETNLIDVNFTCRANWEKENEV